MAAAGPIFLADAANLGCPLVAFKIITGLLDVDSNLSFPAPTRRSLRGRTHRVLKGKTHRRRGGSDFRVRAAKYRNKLTASVITVPSVYIFKKFGQGPPPYILFPPSPHFIPPNNTCHLLMLLSPLYCLCGFSGPPWPTSCLDKLQSSSDTRVSKGVPYTVMKKSLLIFSMRRAVVN